MAKTTKGALPFLTASIVVALALAGCAPAASPPGGSAGGTASSGKATQPPAHQQGKLKGVPTKCPPVDDVSASTKTLFKGVSPSSINGALICEYYVSSAKGSPVISMNFEPFADGTALNWEALAMKAQPAAQAVTGTGDAAVFFTSARYSEFAFISGTTVCNMTASPQFTQAQLANAADFVLEG